MNKKNFLKLFDNIESGSITITDPEGKEYFFGGKIEGINCDLKIHDWNIVSLVTKRGDIGLGESYMENMWDSTEPANFLCFLSKNLDTFKANANGSFFSRILFFIYNNYVRANTKFGSKKNIISHYDLGNDFYSMWLDPTMTYSSSLRSQNTDSLENAQINKYKRIIDKIDINGADILEIGCGWGGFAEVAANHTNNIDSITISDKQYEFAKERLQNKANIILKDYRDVNKIYDRIVSIEMFEAVGEKYWKEYFNTLKSSLNKGGKAIVQTIFIRDEDFDSYRKTSDYIRHHVFPGGMLPSKARFKDEIEKAGLEQSEVFDFGLDYAWTLRKWKENIAKVKNQLIKMGYTDKFLRGWNFYLDISTAGFESGKVSVMQAEILNG